MDSLGKLVDPYDTSGTTKLLGETIGIEPSYTGLLPNIQFASVFPPRYGAVNASDQWILHLHGAFGTTAGSITLNDQQLNLQKPWDPENLYAILAAGPSGSYGPIVVNVAGHKSNAVPLTQWNGTVAQSFIDNSIGTDASIEIVCPVRGIGDTHFGRTDMFTGTSFLVTDVRLEAMAACTYNMSGTWNSSDGKYEYRLSGSGSVDPLETSSTGKTKMGSINSKGLENKLSYSLPAELPGEIAVSLTLTGSLKTSEVKTGALVSTESKTSKWQTGDQQEYFVKLGTDYSIYKSRSCTNKYTGLTKCTEVWDLKPNAFSVPTAQTQG